MRDDYLRNWVKALPTHVHERVGDRWDKTDIVAVLTTAIVYVTGMHNHLGNIADYIRSVCVSSAVGY